MLHLNIVIPSYNEFDNLAVLIPQITAVLDAQKIDFTVSIIDRATSTDDTPSLAALHPAVRIINRTPADSYGDAVRTGIKQNNADLILFMDADGSHSPEFILQLLDQKNKADIVIASRYIDGGGSFNTPILKLLSIMVNLSYRVVLNIPAKDVSNSFKLYKKEVLENLVLRSDNFDIIEEIMFKALRANKQLKILEIPFYFKERLYGKTKRDLVSFSFSFLITLVRLRFS